MSGLGPEHSIPLGHGIYMRWLRWAPDRELNPHLAHLEDEEKTGVIVGHVHDDGQVCEGCVLFDTPANQRRKENGGSVWQVISLDPLHIEPSILMSPDKGGCGLHGFIRNGAWIPA